jgi:class 3 adenylate cyclase
LAHSYTSDCWPRQEPRHPSAGALDLDLRCGIHTGEIEHLEGGDISGINVNVAARICSQAGSGEILISDLRRQLRLGSGYQYLEKLLVTLKGIPGQWTLSTLTD